MFGKKLSPVAPRPYRNECEIHSDIIGMGGVLKSVVRKLISVEDSKNVEVDMGLPLPSSLAMRNTARYANNFLLYIGKNLYSTI